MTTTTQEDENNAKHDQNKQENVDDDDDEEEEEEVIWRDDRVRWAEDFDNEDVTGTRNRKKTNGDQDDDEEEEEEEEETAFMDPFKDPDPFQTFDFDFQYSSLPSTNHGSEGSNEDDDDDDDENKVIHISLRGYKKDADQVWQSTGVTLWRASEYLCQYLLRKQIQSDTDRMSPSSFLKGQRILELGAGLGLCGLLAHRLAGPNSEVCITDGDIDALALIRENIERNIPSKQQPSKSSGQVVARQLIWGHDSTETFMKKYCVGVDERGEREVEPFDIVIASDIVYALVIVEPLWETIRLLLRRRGRRRNAAGGGGGRGDSSCNNDKNDKNNNDDSVSSRPRFLMAYAKREVPVTIEMVLDSATRAGFSYDLVDEDPEGIWIYSFWWSNDDDHDQQGS